jgi:putative ABC transport system ATP-binding protein
MIKIKNISRRFDYGKSSTDALIDINLEIKEGEFIAIVGPSGSGKSSLLSLIGGLDSPTEGSILVRRKDISEYNDEELSKYRNIEVGFIFQEFHLEPFLTVEKNVLLPTYFGEKNDTSEEYAKKLIKEVELEDKIHTRARELSGGQKQRTAIARALINRPKILLGDEPTGNLDMETGKTILKLMQKLHKKHKITLIIATHDASIAKIAERVIKIKDGKIIK